MHIEAIIAWLMAAGVLLASVIYPLRRICAARRLPTSHPLCRVYHALRTLHKPLGVCMIPLTFLHCRLSSQKLGINLGTLCLLLLVTLFITYAIRKLLKGRWLRLHRALTATLWMLITLHIFIDTERIREYFMVYFALTNMFWYFIAYALLTFAVMRFIPADKRKKILTYTIQGTPIEKALGVLSIASRYAMMGFSLFLPISGHMYLVAAGTLLYLAGLILSTFAMWQFSKAKADQPITWGLYRISRHPMQVMGSIMCIGIAMASNNPWFWLLTILNMLSAYPMFLMQERYCSEKYGEQYVAYMRKTPRILFIKKNNR